MSLQESSPAAASSPPEAFPPRRRCSCEQYRDAAVVSLRLVALSKRHSRIYSSPPRLAPQVPCPPWSWSTSALFSPPCRNRTAPPRPVPLPPLLLPRARKGNKHRVAPCFRPRRRALLLPPPRGDALASSSSATRPPSAVRFRRSSPTPAEPSPEELLSCDVFILAEPRHGCCRPGLGPAKSLASLPLHPLAGALLPDVLAAKAVALNLSLPFFFRDEQRSSPVPARALTASNCSICQCPVSISRPIPFRAGPLSTSPAPLTSSQPALLGLLHRPAHEAW
ncbi:proline-rich protein 36-like [Triticum dicoccoides]|uniref:proline-rich protein 36-like n=1 Tax=Triticum dicoccoides TaxID=85692 RepID=UPI00188F1DC4|nr:proline-rich protein 36-like [Triticum dicoccoides]